MTTREKAVDAAGKKLAASRVACAQMTPREQAEAAHKPYPCPIHGVVHSVDELEQQIRVERGLEPHARSA